MRAVLEVYCTAYIRYVKACGLTKCGALPTPY